MFLVHNEGINQITYILQNENQIYENKHDQPPGQEMGLPWYAAAFLFGNGFMGTDRGGKAGADDAHVTGGMHHLRTGSQH